MGVCRQNRFGTAKRQKYRIGDIVWMPEFQCEAVVMGSIKDLVETSKVIDFYQVKFENGKKLAWHHENTMVLIEELEKRYG